MNFTENHDFSKNAHIAKTSIIPKDYQGFGALRSPKIINFHKFHDFHEICWNFIEKSDFS